MPIGENLLNLRGVRPVGGGRKGFADLPRHRNIVEPVKAEPLWPLLQRFRRPGQNASDQLDAAAAFDRLLVQIGVDAERISHDAVFL